MIKDIIIHNKAWAMSADKAKDDSAQLVDIYFELQAFFQNKVVAGYQPALISEALLSAARDVMPSNEAFLEAFEHFRATRSL